jgi:hypothetical protein
MHLPEANTQQDYYSIKQVWSRDRGSQEMCKQRSSSSFQNFLHVSGVEFKFVCLWKLCIHTLTQTNLILISCPVQLPAAPSSLQPRPSTESSLLSEFQEELVTLAASLQGHSSPPSECNTVKKAHAYITDAVDNFFKAVTTASKAGLPSWY